ncbi:VWA domain-containing protein [Marinilabiliaceae bacterium JC017]|nr:VWA domain-containing protein [Marinilabiliaceae bacterium JC017]
MKAFENLNWQQFHFIREEWLWAFIPLLMILLLVILSNRDKTKWKVLIASHLRPYLFTQSSKTSTVLPALAFLMAGSLLICAMAGPTWKKVEVPGGKASAVLLIGLDLSQSMLTADVQPTRLERAKLKIYDLLEKKPGTRIGLFAYAGTAHPVVPLCSDYNLVKHHAESLHPAIMPIRGTNMNYALNLADTILSRYDAPSTLLLVTDEINPTEAGMLQAFTQNTIHKINILQVSTATGGEVPGFRRGSVLQDKTGKTVYSAPDVNVFKGLNQNEKISVYPMTLDKSDVEQIASEVRKFRDFRLDDETSDEMWQDMGWYLLVPALLLSLLWFRKGWMIHWCWIGTVLSFSSCSPDSPQSGWWYTNDYLGQHFYKSDRFEDAADRFGSLPHKGVAYYKAGNYEAAVAVFALDSSDAGHYNRGLALTHMGRFEEASEAFTLALESNPDLEVARKSLVQSEQLIRQRDSVSQLMGETTKMKEPDKKTPLKERKASGKDEELTSGTEVDELPDHGDRVTDEVETNITKAEEMEHPEEMQQQGQQKEAQNIMLRKISADPGEFLRRRFKFQKEKYYEDVTEGEEVW